MRIARATFFLFFLAGLCLPNASLLRGETLSVTGPIASREVLRLNESTSAECLELGKLPAGQALEIHTEARVYRLTVVDPKTCETNARVSLDGRRFSEPAKVYFLGATHGRQAGGGEMLVQMGRIKAGLRVELGLGSLSRFDRALSEPVTDVRLLSTQTR